MRYPFTNLPNKSTKVASTLTVFYLRTNTICTDMAGEGEQCNRNSRWSLEGMTALVSGGTRGIG